MSTEEKKEIINSLSQELRRGTIVLSALCRLKKPKYGYSLVQDLEEHGMAVDPSTLYPLLRRLEKQGLLLSEWETSSGKPRKYYSMTELGAEVLAGLKEHWEDMTRGMSGLFDTEDGE